MKTKNNFLLATVRNGARRIPLGFIFAIAVTFLHQDARATATVNLGSTTNFSILAGSGITISGAPNSTTNTGDVGTFPTTTITGIGNMVFLSGTNHAGDAVTQTGKVDLITAYTDAFARVPDQTYAPIFDLGGLTLTNGVYNDPSSFGITGTLMLDAKGDPNAAWIFQTGSTLTTAGSSLVLLTNGAQASHVFWQVGSSATLGTYSEFVGTIMASNSITLNTGAIVDGRALAWTAAVSLDSNAIGIPSSVPEPGSTLLFGVGLVALLALRWRAFPLI